MAAEEEEMIRLAIEASQREEEERAILVEEVIGSGPATGSDECRWN